MSKSVLQREIRRKGGVLAVAQALQVTPQAVYMWISGKRAASDGLLAYLGLKRVERLVKT